MKSHYHTFSVTSIQKEIDAAARKEMEKYRDEVYDKITWDIFQQAMAVCFTALELMGWRKKRLTDFKNRCDDVCDMMFRGVMGREYTTRDALQRLKDEYGIDLTESQYDYDDKK